MAIAAGTAAVTVVGISILARIARQNARRKRTASSFLPSAAQSPNAFGTSQCRCCSDYRTGGVGPPRNGLSNRQQIK